MKLSKKFVFWMFLVISTVESCSYFFNSEIIHLWLKPLVMPLLIWYFLLNSEQFFRRINKLVVLALAFSWGGDVLLLFGTEGLSYFQGELFFIGGLLSFLIAHLIYARIFFLAQNKPLNYYLVRKQPWWPLLIITIGSGMYYWFFPNLNELTLPVLVYTMVIMTMVLFSVNRYKNVNKISFQMSLLGALLFMVSDMIIGLNKFVYVIDYSGFFIMSLYIAGQFFIVNGILKFKKETVSINS